MVDKIIPQKAKICWRKNIQYSMFKLLLHNNNLGMKTKNKTNICLILL